MEENKNDFSGQDSRDNQQFGNESAAAGYGNSDRQPDERHQSDPTGRNASKFEQDNDDFLGNDENFGEDMNLSTGGFTGSNTSSDLSRNSEGAFTSDDMDMEHRNATGTNDSERSKRTNDEDDFLNSDWNSRDL